MPHNFTISVSRFTLPKEKKETTLLEADVDTMSVIEDGKSSREPLHLQKGIDGSENSCDWSLCTERHQKSRNYMKLRLQSTY